MNLENPESSLSQKITEQIQNRQNAQILNFYWTTLKTDIQQLAKSELDDLPNAYVFLYSISKKYLQNFTQKSVQKIEKLYEFFHIIFNNLFNDDPAKLSSLVQRDNDIESLLLKHFKAHSNDGKTPKFIFDILLLCMKIKDQMDAPNPFEAEILSVVLESSICEDEFLSRKSQKLISRILDMKSKSLSTLVTKTHQFIVPILASWCLKSKEVPKALELVKKAFPYFSQENKLQVFEQLLTILDGKSSVLVRTKIFEIFEIGFASGYFPIKITKHVLESLIKIEDRFLQLLTDKKLIITFFKSRLQVLLNFYTLDPSSAKSYIPSFISSLFEFFANDNYADLVENAEKDLELDQQKSSKRRSIKKAEQPETPELDSETTETFNFYKRFSFRLFELLIDNTFDFALFAEMNPHSIEGNINQLGDLLTNMDLEGDVSNFSTQTTVAKIFVLINHVLSSRFASNFGFVLHIITSMINRISELGFRDSIVFNGYISQFYISVRNFIKTENPDSNTVSKLEGFLSSVLSAGDLLLIIPSIFKITLGQQFDVTNLNQEEFVFFIRILAQRGHSYRFAALFHFFGMVMHYAIDTYSSPTTSVGMVKEEDNKEANVKEATLNKITSNFVQQMVSMIGKFNFFDLSDSVRLVEYSDFVIKTMTIDRVFQNQLLVKQFVIIINSAMLFCINNSQKIDKHILEEFCSLLKSTGLLAKFCKLFLKNPKQANRVYLENFLKLFSKLLPNDYTSSVITKNITRIDKTLKEKDATIMAKAVTESAIISCLLVGFESLSQNHDLFNLSLVLVRNLFACSAQGSAKMGFKVLSSMLTNVHRLQYSHLLQIFDEVMTQFLAGKLPDKKFEGACLKFISSLVKSYSVNLTKDEFKEVIHKFCEKYFNFVVFNFKNRNQKIRKLSQIVLIDVFEKYHEVVSDENQNRVINQVDNETYPINENSFVLCCLISGLAGETVLAKASCIEAIAFVLKQFAMYMCPKLIHSTMKVVVLLIKEKEPEIYTSALKFMTRILKKQNLKLIQDNIELIIEAVFEWDSESAKKANAKLKNFISLLNRKFVI